MAKLKLSRSPLQVLEIELPEGGVLRLEIKNPTVKQSKTDQRKLIQLGIDWKADNITTTEYSVAVIVILCNPFNVEELEELEVEHINQIAKKITELKTDTEEDKKKQTN